MTTLTIPDSPFNLADAAAIGISSDDVYRMIDDGAVRRVVHGAFVPASTPDTPLTRAAAVARVVAPHHVVIDRTAALIHGVNALTYAELDLDVPLETCALRGRTRSRRRGIDGHCRDLVPADIMELGGVTVTVPLRTACDLGCNLRRREAFAVMCALARAHGLVTADFLRTLPRYRGRRGVRQLKELAPLVDPRVESAREAWTLLTIHDAGLPAPEPQFWIEIGEVPTYRLDFAYVHARVCVEYDGIDSHELTAEQRRYDEERRQWLRDHGWTVIVVRRGDFTGDHLDRWLRELRDALRPAMTNRRW
ncbi:hypothetical protein J2S40_002031 [Nocardioides luteus]|uniref:DUF559 domain-containing protein n=1 Tax=Nocardioides luteus TaxID=1844 RepID=A0ABQ5SYI7_9ACTN|nr:DUF559 domain-containing protein [Nocardioides luteus]MDR7310973.1 hypothetical protein [Nocardioides luteus]GGR39426.1 hypothetical protein GCM10010197_00230 [Nocardioides luteus]GLJ69247.1 hypothetical protein GCM10017579_32830 [Nocardioides luteus]